MLAIRKDDVLLTYHQQSNEIVDHGTQVMRGSLSMDHDNNIASFVEDCKTKSTTKNPVFWKGKHLSLRIDKEGKIRGTFRIGVPSDLADSSLLVGSLGLDFTQVLDTIQKLSEGKSPRKKTSKRKKVA